MKAPASSGNLGAGFDCVGMALDWYGEFDFVMGRNPQESESTDGVSSSIIASMGERAFAASLAELGITTDTISVSFRGEIPVGSGLGTSAMARAAGITAAACWTIGETGGTGGTSAVRLGSAGERKHARHTCG